MDIARGTLGINYNHESEDFIENQMTQGNQLDLPESSIHIYYYLHTLVPMYTGNWYSAILYRK